MNSKVELDLSTPADAVVVSPPAPRAMEFLINEALNRFTEELAPLVESLKRAMEKCISCPVTSEKEEEKDTQTVLAYLDEFKNGLDEKNDEYLKKDLEDIIKNINIIIRDNIFRLENLVSRARLFSQNPQFPKWNISEYCEGYNDQLSKYSEAVQYAIYELLKNAEKIESVEYDSQKKVLTIQNTNSGEQPSLESFFPFMHEHPESTELHGLGLSLALYLITEKTNGTIKFIIKNGSVTTEIGLSGQENKQYSRQEILEQVINGFRKFLEGIAHETRNPMNYLPNLPQSTTDIIGDLENENHDELKRNLDVIKPIMQKIEEFSSQIMKVLGNYMAFFRDDIHEMNLHWEDQDLYKIQSILGNASKKIWNSEKVNSNTENLENRVSISSNPLELALVQSFKILRYFGLKEAPDITTSSTKEGLQISIPLPSEETNCTDFFSEETNEETVETIPPHIHTAFALVQEILKAHQASIAVQHGALQITFPFVQQEEVAEGEAA